MNYLNRCLLLGRYRSTTIIDDNVSCLVIVINDEDGDLTILIITSTDVAKKNNKQLWRWFFNWYQGQNRCWWKWINNQSRKNIIFKP